MEETTDKVDPVTIECKESPKEDEDKLTENEPPPNLDSLKQINCQVGIIKEEPQEDATQVTSEKASVPTVLKIKETSTGTKVKRKTRSSRRRQAMVSNASLHFSDTDSEGELTMISTQVRSLSTAKSESLDYQKAPVISVTLEGADVGKRDQACTLCTPCDESIPRSSSYIENLTDVDEIYTSEPENEQKESRNSLTVAENPYQADTDLEELDAEEEVQATIYIKPRSDILCELSGETIMTKEGDGPFSVEIRNKMSADNETKAEAYSDAPDIVVLPITDEEEMDISENEDFEEACCSQKVLFEDMDSLAASQIVMRNINKMENTLAVKDAGDDAISDCHTDVEDVDEVN